MVKATDLSDPQGVGIVFVDTPDLTGPAASAHDAMAIFEVEYWRSSTMNAVSPLLAQFAAPVLVEKIRYQVETDTANGYGYDGIFRVTISDVAVGDSTASVTVCNDYTDVEFTYLDGRPSVGFEEAGAAQFESSTFSLSTLDGGVTWRPEDYVFNGTSC